MRLDIEGLQEAQDANNRLITALKPSGAAGEGVRDATIAAHRYAAIITHVDTGAWRASHRMDVRGLRGIVSVDERAQNPRSRTPVSQYATIWEERGGRLAVYTRTEEEKGDEIARRFGVKLDAVIDE